jgi:hypothetical protein
MHRLKSVVQNVHKVELPTHTSARRELYTSLLGTPNFSLKSVIYLELNHCDHINVTVIHVTTFPLSGRLTGEVYEVSLSQIHTC